MATIRDQINKLKAIKASGAAALKNGDEGVTFRTQKELDQAIADLEAEERGGRIKRTVAGYRSGL